MQPNPKIQQAAEFLETAVRNHVMDEKGVAAETCLACAGWMAGTQLYRLEIDPTLAVKPGTVVLSEPVNQRLPGLMNMVAAMATQGEAAPPDMDNADTTGAQPIYRLSLAQTQEGLDPLYLSYARRASLAPEELLHASTGALGILAAKSRPVLGLSLARYIAHCCMLEAAKTAGRKPQMSDFSGAHLRPLASLLPPRSLLQRLSGWFDNSTTRNYLHTGHK
jgi:hypothetical protein